MRIPRNVGRKYGFENHQTPETEMVRRHRITEAAGIEFENGDDSDKFMGPSLMQ